MSVNLYVPEGIGDNFKYVVPSNNYFDLYDVDYLQPNETYVFYRHYDNMDEDLFIQMTRTTTNYNYGYLSCAEVSLNHDYIYRKDYPQILQCVFIFTLGFVLLINIITSIIKKGGILSGLL